MPTQVNSKLTCSKVTAGNGDWFRSFEENWVIYVGDAPDFDALSNAV